MAGSITNKAKAGGKDIPQPTLKNFLIKNKIVKIKPVMREGKWETLLDKRRRDAFMYNSTKRTFTLPNSLKTGTLVQILDDIELVQTPQYKELLTERQFFEKQLNRDLSIYNKKGENFWLDDSMTRVVLTKDGEDLNMEDPVDVIRLRILQANRETIAPSLVAAKAKPTYEFYIEDEEVETSRELDIAEKESKAFNYYNEYKVSSTKMKNFLKVSNKGFSPGATDSWLAQEVFKSLKEDLDKFLSIAEDPLFDDKAFIYDAVRAGALARKGRDSYMLDDDNKTGNIYDTIAYLNKPENSALYNIIKERITRANK